MNSVQETIYNYHKEQLYIYNGIIMNSITNHVFTKHFRGKEILFNYVIFNIANQISSHINIK